jgi:hypothetical protein
MTRSYYSLRSGLNPNAQGLALDDVSDLFVRVFKQLRQGGYFDQAFGFQCVDLGDVPGSVPDVQLEMLLRIREKDLWPIEDAAPGYYEDDLFDVIEFLYDHVSKPIDGTMHSYAECGMHWNSFNQQEGRREFREKMNAVLEHYQKRFELSESGDILQRAAEGFEAIFDADIPSDDLNITKRVKAAVLRYRRHGATLDDRRHAVRDLADVLEYLRPHVKALLTSNDEKDLFSIANNFGIRHCNDKQKTDYDAALWLSWMFYYYLATIHVLLRKAGLGTG